MLYLAEKKSSAGSSDAAPAATGVEEEEVDRVLAASDGKIERKRDPQL